MRRITLRTAAANKIRMLLTVLSVALGTAYISGSLILTQSLEESFASIVDSGVDGIDVGLVGSASSPHGVPLSVVSELAARPDVRAVNVTGDGPGTPSGTRRSGQSSLVITGSDGRPLQAGSSGAHPLAAYPFDAYVGRPPIVVEGTEPREAHEIMLNSSAAKRGKLHVGDSVTVITSSERLDVTISGIYDIPRDTAGWIGVMFTPERYLELFTDGQYASQVIISAADGVSPMDLRNSLGQRYPTLTPLLPEQIAERQSGDYVRQLGFMTYMLAAFGVIALFVGSFIITNTFAMILGQRTREFALLRSIGVSALQVRTSVFAEAAIAGVIGCITGIAVGISLVVVVINVLNQVGDGLSAISLTFTPKAIIVPFVVGMIITIIAAAEPARRAGSLPPIDALRPADDRSDHSLRLRTVFGVLAAVLGVGFGIAGAHFPTIGGFDMDLYQRLSAVAVGALFLLAGLWLSGPALASISPGLPIGPIGRLASRNSSRNPRRTATTAFALALGVGLVACVGVIGATAQASVFGLVESKVKAPFVLDSPNGGHSSGLAGSPTGGGGLSIPEEAITTVENLDGVNSVGVLMSAPLQADHWDNPTTTVVSGDISPFVDIGVVRGTSEFGDQPGAMISTTYAKQSGLGPGDTFTLRPYLGGEGTDSSVVTIRGVYEETGLLGHMVINLAGALRVLPDLEAYNRKTAFVTSDGRFSDSMLRRELEDAVAQYLVVQVKAKEEYKGALGTQVNQMVSLIYGLLALAVVIAVMGIINTLALSVSERTRELGTLRAIGVSRSQIRRMIQLEAVQMSVFGALCGVVVGVFAGWCVVTVLQDKGMSSPHVPWSQVALMMAGSVVVGLLAALVPAQKAAATPPLEAIAE